MPVAKIDAPEPIVGEEPQGQHRAEKSLDGQGISGNPDAHAHHPIQFIPVQRGLDVQTGLQVDLFPHDHREKGGEEHQPQATQLNQRNDYQLPEHRKVRPRIHHHQPGDTGG